jgi:hypothetical protein
MNERGYTFDVFLSHAVEDKISIAQELYCRLKEAGLSIWYSGSDLTPGDFIEDSVRTAITHSEYGIVIFSQFFLSKNWTMNEYYSMAQLESEKRITIIPILFDVTPEDLAKKNLNMADRFAIHASRGMDHVVSKVLESIKKKKLATPSAPPKKYSRALKWTISLILMLLIGIPVFSYLKFRCWDCPTTETLAKTIEGRMQNLQLEIEKDWIKSKNEQPASTGSVDSIFGEYMSLKSHYRNEYEFTNGFQSARSRRRVESILGVDLTLWAPSNEYNLTTPHITLNRQRPFITYTYRNTQPVTYTITNTSFSDDSYLVKVAYVNNIRCIKVTLSFPTENDDMRRHRMRLIGFMPDETFVFEKEQDDWQLREVR